MATERRRRDAAPVRHPSHIRSLAELDRAADDALACGGGHHDLPGERAGGLDRGGQGERRAARGGGRARSLTRQVPAPSPASASSIDPRVAVARVSRPNERLVGSAKRSGRSALARDTSPPPWSCGARARPRSSASAVPVCTSADFTWATVQPGWRCTSSAAAPATCGEAMLVPEEAVQPLGTEERTSTPGAETSGFSRSEIAVGPTEEKSARTIVDGVPPTSTAATVIARAELPGDETEPGPTVPKSFPAATTGTTPAAAAASSARATMSRVGSISGSPSERLTTSIPSRTAASIAATSSGEFPFGLRPTSVRTSAL